jgi:hypothetical protein
MVLEFKGIDVILGMDWLNKHKVLIYYAEKSIKLTTPNRNVLEYIAEPVVTAKRTANNVKLDLLDANQGLDVPIVNEFSDVFPKELPSMPPDRDVEFVIEFVLDTTPICKRSYMVIAKQLAELKDQIKELLEKSYIHPSSSPWGAPMIFFSEEGWYSKDACGLPYSE